MLNKLNKEIIIKIIRTMIISFILFSFFQSFQIYTDFKNYKENYELMCRYNNVINANGKVCYGNADIPEGLPDYWTGNHIWNVENKKIIDYTCPDCDIKEIIGCLNINNGYIEPKFDSIENTIISYYFLEFSLMKYLNIIS